MATIEETILCALMVPQVDPFEDNATGPNSPACRWGLPLNIGGLSGIGKSQRIAAATRAVGLPFQKVFPSHKQPEDFSGAPMQTPDGIVMECMLPQARALINAGRGVLFIDELTTARPAVQGACLGVVDERRVGDDQLPNTVRVITAMNPPEYAAGGFALEPALANRLCHIDAPKPSAGEWADWMMGRRSQPLPRFQDAELMVKQNWHKHWPTVRALISEFIKAQGDETLHNQPTPDAESSGGAWPSHRMWYLGGCAIATVRCLGMPKEIENQLLFGCVGTEAETEWVEWCQKADLPDPEEMLTQGWIADPKRLDITTTALSAMSSWLVNHPDKNMRNQLAGSAWNIVGDTYEAGLKDIILPVSTELALAGLNHENPDKASAASAIKVMKKIGQYSKYATVSA